MLIQSLAVSLIGLSVIMGPSIIGNPAASQTPDKCSTKVKQALKSSKWTLATDFSSGAQDWTVSTNVASDGAMTMETRRGLLKIRCEGQNIFFDWKEDSRKRYTMTFKTDGNFDGSRTGNSDDYSATLTKKK
jgi:hypothetical protein